MRFGLAWPSPSGPPGSVQAGPVTRKGTLTASTLNPLFQTAMNYRTYIVATDNAGDE